MKNILSPTRTQWLSVKQFCDRYNLKKDHVYNLIHSEGFPAKKFGKGLYRIDENGAIEFIDRVFN